MWKEELNTGRAEHSNWIPDSCWDVQPNRKPTWYLTVNRRPKLAGDFWIVDLFRITEFKLNKTNNVYAIQTFRTNNATGARRINFQFEARAHPQFPFANASVLQFESTEGLGEVSGGEDEFSRTLLPPKSWPIERQIEDMSWTRGIQR